MKKFFAISIAGLAAALMFTACTGKKAPETERLSAEEIMQLPKSYWMDDRVFFPKDFSEVWNHYDGYKPAAVVKGKATSVKYYYGFETEYRCTLVEFQIDEVIDEYNTAALKPGDVITLSSSSYIEFTTNDGIPSDAFCEFLSEKTGLDIHDRESFQAARDAYSAKSAKDAAAQKFELIPKKGVEYVFAMSSEFAYPLQEGESYTMFVYATEPMFAFGQECYFSTYVHPLNEELSREKLNEKYGWRLKPYLSINDEIAAMFKLRRDR